MYPGLYVNPAWPTRHRVIPWKLFALLSGQGGAVNALDRLTGAHGVAAGIGVAMSDKGSEITARMVRDAFPEVADG